MSRIDRYAGPFGGGSYGYSIGTSVGEQHDNLRRSRDTDRVNAKRVCLFHLLGEAAFGQVVEFIRSRLYAPPRSARSG